MPYIKLEDRANYDDDIFDIVVHLGENGWPSGHVNYVIFSIVLDWFRARPCYATICSIMGTLSSVAQEFYRKQAAPYEDEAEKKNGPI